MLPLVGLAVTWIWCLVLMRYAERWGLARVERGKTGRLIPRAGGLGIFAAWIITSLILCAQGLLDLVFILGIMPASAAVALSSLWDDLNDTAPLLRLAVQILLSLWVVIWLLPLGPLDVGGGLQISWGWLGAPLMILILVWHTNLFNFMDGLDGLAGSQAVFIGLVGGAILVWDGRMEGGILLWVLSAACAAFLRFNWWPAQVFMGDTGSCFLGFAFAAVFLREAVTGGVSLMFFGLLNFTFVFDATVTLLRRLVHGEPVLKPHLSHAYQRAEARGHAPPKVVLVFGLLNAMMATLAVLQTQYAGFAFGAAGMGFVVLTAVAHWARVAPWRHSPPLLDEGMRSRGE